MVGPWKAKVYDMHNVIVSVKSRRVPGAMTDEEFFSSCNENETESEDYEDLLSEEEKKQLEIALKVESSSVMDDGFSEGFSGHRHSCFEQREIPIEDISSCSNGDSKLEKKNWLGNWGKQGHVQKQDVSKKIVPPRNSLCVDEKVSDLLHDSPSRLESRSTSRHSVEVAGLGEDLRRGRDKNSKRPAMSSENGQRRKESSRESEYKKGLRPTLWLSQSFPLRSEELLPLLDILANKVKAIRRLRDLLMTKLPPGTFPVKVAIPVVPTIRVLVTFTKFEELQPAEEFSTPPSSPGSKSPSTIPQPSTSWLQWLKGPYRPNYSAASAPSGSSNRVEDMQDPFLIPSDYVWTTPEEKKKKMQENKSKPRKGKSSQATKSL